MIWLTWRQHRGEALAAVAVLAALGAVLLAIGLPMHASFDRDIAACIDGSTVDREICSANLSAFQKDFGFATTVLTLLNAIPFLLGALIGAPLLARELETGTWQLAWTQAVPRMRWLMVKLVAVVTLIVLLTAAFSALIAWFRQPLDALYGRYDPGGFDVEGLVPTAYALFAFAAGAAAGAILRRSIPALTLSLLVFVAARATVESVLRPGYRTPLTLVDNIEAGGRGIAIGTGNRTDWTLGEGFIDATGQRLTYDDINSLADAARNTGVTLTTYLHDQGIQRWVDYHPANRFWEFQYIEAGIFCGAGRNGAGGCDLAGQESLRMSRRSRIRRCGGDVRGSNTRSRSTLPAQRGGQRLAVQHDQRRDGPREHHVQPAVAAGFGGHDVARLDHDDVVVLEALDQAGRHAADTSGRSISGARSSMARSAAMTAVVRVAWGFADGLRGPRPSMSSTGRTDSVPPVRYECVAVTRGGEEPGGVVGDRPAAPGIRCAARACGRRAGRAGPAAPATSRRPADGSPGRGRPRSSSRRTRRAGRSSGTPSATGPAPRRG